MYSNGSVITRNIAIFIYSPTLLFPHSSSITMFRFKQFTVHQDRTAMKVGTDGVLLGAWAEPEKARSILDIGTGTGLLALMAAQRNREAAIDAIEIEPEAASQARENADRSPWAGRIRIYPVSLFDFFPSRSYDCILCNPPFFNRSTKTPDAGRTLARHTDSLSHPALLEAAGRLLSADGSFYIILPPEEATVFIHLAENYRLYLLRLTRVLPNPGKPPKRYLMKFTFTKKAVQTDELTIELSRHEYTPEYIRLTQDFYLNL